MFVFCAFPKCCLLLLSVFHWLLCGPDAPVNCMHVAEVYESACMKPEAVDPVNMSIFYRYFFLPKCIQ